MSGASVVRDTEPRVTLQPSVALAKLQVMAEDYANERNKETKLSLEKRAKELAQVFLKFYFNRA